jgi:hypothetical protein
MAADRERKGKIMHVSIAVGTILLSSWVLHSPTDEEEAGVPGEIQAPAGTESSGPTMPFLPQSPRPTRDERGRRIGSSGEARGGAAGGATGRPGGAPQQAPGGVPQQAYGIPSAPTDSGQNTAGQPTSASGFGAAGGVTNLGPGAFGPARHPMAPTASDSARPLQRNVLDQSRGAGALGNVGGRMSHPEMAKPFAGFRPTSGVSPYMNLFRTQGDSLDNYTSLVRPQLEQRSLNQQFNHDIRGLEGNARSQNVDLRQLYRSNQTLQGVATPQFYMNYGNYFPGSGQ